MTKLTFPDLVIFDLDGTLVDSAGDIQVAANNTFEELDLPEQPLNQIKRWIGGGAQVFVEQALEYFGKPEWFEQTYRLFMQFYRALPADRTVMFDGVQTLLDQLKQSGVKMAVVSNKPHELIGPIIKHLKLDDYFELVLGGDSLAEKKPSPEPLLHVCRELKVEPNKCWMVGDSSKDAEAAVNAKMPFVGVTYGYALNPSDIRPQGVKHTVVDSLEQLTPLISVERDAYA
ncbi:phosphoglycolate phosphatase [Kangiella spongicola]|jgi:phosphoglycolate phosphatase|uniref:phosphoglycolate phosphatase n=1 Tax=Kangiella spongicola TaxID=796379 RepID=A0A318D8L5_9GAMM|nr:phosphoglycolate phosphatase [Kangiella spongicola]MBV35022.1 phosphoglycolate phosphatase [Rickettsiales bacterium]PXF64245.1 phosphoglycolate phosphatase [Kangiella spongicola]